MFKRTKKIKDTEFVFLTTVLRVRESRMLTRDKMERILDAATYEESAKMLEECGYVDMSRFGTEQVEAALAVHRADILSEIATMSPEKRVIDIFRLKYDYHNAKTLIKAEGAGVSGAQLYSSSGRIEMPVLVKAYEENDMSALPPIFAEAITEARGALARTSNPQFTDIVLDRAMFAELIQLASELRNPFLTEYAKLQVDNANLRAAVRTRLMGRDSAFLSGILIDGGQIKTEILLAAVASGEMNALTSLYARTALESAAVLAASVLSGNGTLTDFELECDNSLIRYMSKARQIGFGIEPVVAFIASLDAEITTARMILTGRLQGVQPELIRERLREINA